MPQPLKRTLLWARAREAPRLQDEGVESPSLPVTLAERKLEEGGREIQASCALSGPKNQVERNVKKIKEQ